MTATDQRILTATVDEARHTDWCYPVLCQLQSGPVTAIPFGVHHGNVRYLMTEEDEDVIVVMLEQYQSDDGTLDKPRVRMDIVETDYRDGHVSLSLEDARNLMVLLAEQINEAQR